MIRPGPQADLVRTAWWALLTLACGCLCVERGTLVRVPDGQRRVEELAVGSQIMSRDDAGHLRAATITRVVSGARTVRELALADGKTLRLTPAHPVHTAAGWTKARHLRVGAVVTTADGRSAVRSIRRLAGRRVVYGLTVSPTDNLFANDVLVHNKSPREYPPTTLADLARTAWEGFSDPPNTDRLAIRIETRPDGTGRAATMTTPPATGVPEGPELWRIVQVTVYAHKATIRMVRERDGHVWILHGAVAINTGPYAEPVLDLCIRGSGPRCRSVLLHAPDNMTGRLQELQQVLQADGR